MTIVTLSILLSVLGTTPPQGEDDTPESGLVEGKVSILAGETAVELPHLGPIVAHLRPIGEPKPVKLPAENPQIQQKNARFHPDFLVVCQGQTVEMPNDDKIYHNVFSYSKPNAFDLGLYRQGTSRSVRFDDPGVVKIYCSIHESMNGVILVTETLHHARVKTDGSFRIADVPPGEYTLVIWCERLPERTSQVTIEAGETSVEQVRITLGGTSDEAQSSRTPEDGTIRKSSAPVDTSCCSEAERP